MWDTPQPSTCGCSKAGVRPRSSTSAVSKSQITNFKTCLQNQSELKKWSCLTRKPGLGKKNSEKMISLTRYVSSPEFE